MREKKALDSIRSEAQRRQKAKMAQQQQPPHHPQDSPETVARKIDDYQRHQDQELGMMDKGPGYSRDTITREEHVTGSVTS